MAQIILDFVEGIITGRPRGKRRHRVHQPTRDEPLWVVKIDEIDVVAQDPERKEALARIASKLRSEGVALVLAGQRPTAAWIGGANVRAHVRYIIWGRFARSSETRLAGGSDEFELPNIGRYGEGHAGVFGVAPMPLRGTYDLGRTFYWGEESGALDRLGQNRLATPKPYRLEPPLSRLAPLCGQLPGSPTEADDAARPADLPTPRRE